MAWGKKVNMGTYNATEHELKAYRWCIRNKIYIAPKAINEALWAITIENNGRTYEDPSHYIKGLIWEKIYEYYRYYYEKQLSQRK
jgi:hypothetical protein